MRMVEIVAIRLRVKTLLQNVFVIIPVDNVHYRCLLLMSSFQKINK
jgi:hypothetical protein